MDSLEFTLSVTPDRLVEIKHELAELLIRVRFNRKQLESLLGKLNFVVACVYSSRVFISRLLNVLRSTPPKAAIPVSDELRADIQWWHEFMEVYNGTSVICTFPWSSPDELISSDACLVACGALSTRGFFHKAFPKQIVDLNLHINALEMLTLVVAVRTFVSEIRGQRFVMYCDNASTVSVVSTGKARDQFMQACLRELVWILAQNEAEIRVLHIDTVSNRSADLLSRWDLSPSYPAEFRQRTSHLQLSELHVPDEAFLFQHTW